MINMNAYHEKKKKGRQISDPAGYNKNTVKIF